MAKRRISIAPVEDLGTTTEEKGNLVIETTTKKVKEQEATTKPKSTLKKVGRPAILKLVATKKFEVTLTEKQNELLILRMKELNIKARLKYIRRLIAQDIKDFEEF